MSASWFTKGLRSVLHLGSQYFSWPATYGLTLTKILSWSKSRPSAIALTFISENWSFGCAGAITGNETVAWLFGGTMTGWGLDSCLQPGGRVSDEATVAGCEELLRTSSGIVSVSLGWTSISGRRDSSDARSCLRQNSR